MPNAPGLCYANPPAPIAIFFTAISRAFLKLGKVIRAKYVEKLKLRLPGLEKVLINSLFQKPWVVYAKRPFGWELLYLFYFLLKNQLSVFIRASHAIAQRLVATLFDQARH